MTTRLLVRLGSGLRQRAERDAGGTTLGTSIPPSGGSADCPALRLPPPPSPPILHTTILTRQLPRPPPPSPPPHTHTLPTCQVRLGEKEALDSLLRFFEQRETLLPTLEFYQERRLKRLGLMDDSE